jgi:hypothetical protein
LREDIHHSPESRRWFSGIRWEGLPLSAKPPTIRYLTPEASSAANSSIQSFSPDFWMKHLVIEFSQFEDGLNSLLRGCGATEFAGEGASVLADATLSPHHLPGSHA